MRESLNAEVIYSEDLRIGEKGYLCSINLIRIAISYGDFRLGKANLYLACRTVIKNYDRYDEEYQCEWFFRQTIEPESAAIRWAIRLLDQEKRKLENELNLVPKDEMELSAEDAAGLLPEGAWIQMMRQKPDGRISMMTGHREYVDYLLRTYPVKRAGESARSFGFGLAVYDQKAKEGEGLLFIETKGEQ